MLPRVMKTTCAIGLAALVLGACGEDREGSVDESGGSTSTTGVETTTAPEPAGPVVATVMVKLSEYEIEPKNVRVGKAGVVSFLVKNAGTILHALEVEGPKGEVETAQLTPGMNAPLKADLSKPGTYEWYCPVGDHKARGMKGKITVAGGGSGASKDDSGASSPGGSGKSGDDSGASGGSGKSEDSGKSGKGKRTETTESRGGVY